MSDNPTSTGEIPVVISKPTVTARTESNAVVLAIIAGTVMIILVALVGSTIITFAGLEPPKYFEVTTTAAIGLLAGILAGGAYRRQDRT